MAPNKKRLEYESFKAVLQNLDPNIRLKLRLRVPSISTVDKLLPVKIQQLTFDLQKMTLNSTTYHFAVFYAGIPDQYAIGGNEHRIFHTPCTQLTIQSPNGKEIIERVVSFEPSSYAIDYIFSLIVPNHKVYVCEAIFKTSDHLPTGIKIKTKAIELGFRARTEWKNLVDEWSLPLDTVTVVMTHTQGWKLNQDFVKDARKLVIDNYYRDEGSWLQIIQTLKNPNIVLISERHTDTIDDFIRFVKNLMGTGKPIGTLLEFEFKRGENCKNLLEKMEGRLTATRKSDRCVIFPMDNGSKLEVSWEKVQDLEKMSEINQLICVLRMIIV